MPTDHNRVPLEDVVAALSKQQITGELAWWLATLDERVYEIEKRLGALEQDR